MRRMLLELVLAAIAVCVVAAATAAVAYAGNPTDTPTPVGTDDSTGAGTPTPTEEPELTPPTPSPIDPPAYGDPAASRLLLIGGLYEIPPQNDCGWATTRIQRVLYRNYETTDVHAMHAPCPEEEDIFIFYPVSGELQRQRADTPRLRLQLIDGKVTVTPGADGCTFVEFLRTTTPYGPDQQPTEIVQLGSDDSPCMGDYGYTYVPSTGELQIWAPSSAASSPTATPSTGITLPNTGGGMPVAPATTWIYVGNALVAAVIALAGLAVATRRR